GRSEANPAPFLKPDCPAFCYSVFGNGHRHIFKRMVMISDEHVGGYDDVLFQVNKVLGRNLATSSNLAAVVQNDDQFVGSGNIWNVQPGTTIDIYGIPDLHVTCDRSVQIARAVDREVLAYESERVSPH